MKDGHCADKDGQRVVALIEPSGVVLTNRRGGEITGTYPELAGMAGALAPHAAVLDGEVVTFNEKGQTSFQRLQRRMHVLRPPPSLLAETPVAFVAFDVLWLDGELLVDRTQAERRRVLDGLGLKGPAWQTAPVLDASPEELLDACRHLGLEGFMAKRLDAPYQPGRRSPAWSKVKCGRRREFVVGGWSTGHGSRQDSIGSLALGCYDATPEEAERRGRPQRLFYVGQAGSGLNEETIGQLKRLFAQIAVPTSPFTNPPRAGLHYAQPILVTEVAYTEVTETGTSASPRSRVSAPTSSPTRSPGTTRSPPASRPRGDLYPLSGRHPRSAQAVPALPKRCSSAGADASFTRHTRCRRTPKGKQK